MNQIDNAINDFNMLKNGSKIIVGLSGGADSVTLLHYLKCAKGFDVIACHINHMLRGNESIRDRDFVIALCKKLQIRLFIKEIDVANFAKENSLTIEQAGRNIRYGFFEEIRLRENADYIATAHTLSDNAETVLLNLTRGTSLLGLCGIPPIRGNIIRPLIYCKRADIEEYCNNNKLCYVTDSTNLQDIYSRNNIRNNVIPVLKQINPAFETAVLRGIKTLKNDNDCLDKLANQLFICSKTENGYDALRLKNAENALRMRAIAKILDENKIEKSAELIFEIDCIISAKKGKLNLQKNIFAEIKDNKLKISERKEPLSYFEDELIFGNYQSKNGEIYKISKYEQKNNEITKKVYKNLLYIVADYDKIIGKAFIRQRKAGDEIELVNRRGKKSLKKLFIDKKLSEFDKSKTLVLADQIGVFAVYGFGAADRVKIDETTKTVLMLEKIK